MKYCSTPIIFSVSLLIVSCSSAQSRVEQIQIPPERIIQKGYSLLPLNEKGWYVVGRNQTQLALGKGSETPDETFVIQGTLVAIEPYKTRDDFVRLVKEGESKSIDRKRYKIIQHDVSAYDKKGTDCAESYVLMVDNAAAKPSGNKGVMILESLALACAHPKNKNIVVNLGYSHRYYPGHQDAAFREKATAVVNSLEFTDF